MRFIATPFHGIVDYAAGVLLIAAPFVLGFADETSAGTWISVLAGLTLLGVSLFTDYEGGLTRRIAIPVHLGVDAVVGLILLATPFAFGFAGAGTFAWLSFVLAGGAFLLLAALTQTSPLQASDKAVSRAYARQARAEAKLSRQTRVQDMRSRRA